MDNKIELNLFVLLGTNRIVKRELKNTRRVCVKFLAEVWRRDDAYEKKCEVMVDKHGCENEEGNALFNFFTV